MWMWVCLVCQAVVATAKSSEREPTYTEYGNSRAVDLYALGTSLAKQLVWPTVQHVNYTLHADTVSSYHLFVTNKTEPCHTHAGSTSSRVISGSGGRCGLLCLLMLPSPHSNHRFPTQHSGCPTALRCRSTRATYSPFQN